MRLTGKERKGGILFECLNICIFVAPRYCCYDLLSFPLYFLVTCHTQFSIIIACTSHGKLIYHPVFPQETNPSSSSSSSSSEQPEISKPPTHPTPSPLPTSSLTLSLGIDKLRRMRVFPRCPTLFATGGDERDLSLWKLIPNTEEEKEKTPFIIKCDWKAKNVC